MYQFMLCLKGDVCTARKTKVIVSYRLCVRGSYVLPFGSVTRRKEQEYAVTNFVVVSA
jgi:hypothetical protein